MEFDKTALDFLACPQCKGDLIYSESPEGLTCNGCKLFYFINEGIPVMLVDEAEKLETKSSE